MTPADERRAMAAMRDALAHEDVESVRGLLDRGLSTRATFEDTGLTPLLMALGDVESQEIIRDLLARDSGLDTRDAGGYGPVARAAMGLKPAQLQLLLGEYRADPYEPCGNGASPLVNALSESRWSSDPRRHELLRQIAAIFVRYGVDLDRPDRGGARLTPRHMAERAGVSLA